MKPKNLIEFDSIHTKPKVRSIAYLSAAFAVLYGLMVLLKVNPVFIMFSLLAYLTAVFVMLLKAFVGQIRYNPYSYNTIYYISFALFDLSVILSQMMIISFLFRGMMPVEHLLATMFGYLVSSAQTFMIYSLPFIMVFSIGLFVSNIMLIRKEGRSFVNLLGMILAVLMISGELILIFGNGYYSGSEQEVMIHEILFNVFSAVYLYYECMIIGTIISMLIVISWKPAYDQDFIIILGCSLMPDGTPTPLLKGRIDIALQFYRKQLAETGKAPVFIPSGGQGSDEANSESQAMKTYLLAQGIPEENIIMEDRSSDTHENMLYSKQIIDSIVPDAKVVYATTRYHVFRSGLKARRVKLKATGIGSRTKWYYWPNATVREFVGILTEHKTKQALILGSMIIIYVIGTIMMFAY